MKASAERSWRTRTELRVAWDFRPGLQPDGRQGAFSSLLSPLLCLLCLLSVDSFGESFGESFGGFRAANCGPHLHLKEDARGVALPASLKSEENSLQFSSRILFHTICQGSPAPEGPACCLPCLSGPRNNAICRSHGLASFSTRQDICLSILNRGDFTEVNAIDQDAREIS